MLRSLLLLTLLALATWLNGQYTATVKTNASNSTSRTWRAWSNEAVAVNYPGGWMTEVSGGPGTVVRFFAPLDTSITIGGKVELTNEQIGEMSLADFMLRKKDEVKTQVQDGHLIGGVAQREADEESQILEYTGTVNGVEMHFRQTVRINKGKAFLLTYSAPDELYDEYLFMAEAMFGSFRLLP